MALEVGRVCMKVAGREAGRYCVVVKKIDDAFVIVSGPKILTGVKRRRCNIEHLEPTPYSLEIKEDASDVEIIEAYKKANLIKKLDLKLPPAHLLKQLEKKESEGKEEKKEEKTEEKKKEKGEKKKVTEKA